jgi:hypothetical protein
MIRGRVIQLENATHLAGVADGLRAAGGAVMADTLTFDNAVPALLKRVPELRPVYQRLVELEGRDAMRKYTLVGNAQHFAYDLCREAASTPDAAAKARSGGHASPADSGG